MRLKFHLLFIVCCISLSVGAQDTTSISTFPSDLDSIQVDSFYRKFTIDLNKCDKPELYFEVFRWLNTKYRYGGTGKKGVDCSGFVSEVYRNVYRKELPHSSSGMFMLCDALKKKEIPAEGDLVFFKIHSKRVSHVGIYLQHGMFAHASVYNGVTINDLEGSYYKKYFFKAGRVE